MTQYSTVSPPTNKSRAPGCYDTIHYLTAARSTLESSHCQFIRVYTRVTTSDNGSYPIANCLNSTTLVQATSVVVCLIVKLMESDRLEDLEVDGGY